MTEEEKVRNNAYEYMKKIKYALLEYDMMLLTNLSIEEMNELFKNYYEVLNLEEYFEDNNIVIKEQILNTITLRTKIHRKESGMFDKLILRKLKNHNKRN